MPASNTQDALARLRKWRLERDDTSDPGGRIYRGPDGTVYHSVTRILSETSDKTGLERWEARLGAAEAAQQRQTAATRGTLTHNQAEYLLKTAQKLARGVANKRNAIHWDDNGLARIPTPITRWALEKVYPNLPKAGWSAAGYARSLTSWIMDNVTEILACEFSIHHPAGFAGTADGLIGIQGTGAHSKVVVADWKTTQAAKRLDEDHSYVHQLGAYSLGLEHLTGIRPEGGIIVLARRTGEPQQHLLSEAELRAAEQAYLKRVEQYYAAIQGGTSAA